jgi:23S rRNA (pseudouridine1915-N3)-methyltransferase
MKLEVWAIGKCSHHYLQEGLAYYAKKIKFYSNFDLIEWPEPKSMRSADPKIGLQAQRQLLYPKLNPDDFLILLDEHGLPLNSIQFSEQINRILIHRTKKCVFLIGGPFGFHEDFFQRAQAKLSLSPLTFSHDMVRLILLEQIYRGFTILRNEPYHHS